MNEFGLVMNS